MVLGLKGVPKSHMPARPVALVGLARANTLKTQHSLLTHSTNRSLIPRLFIQFLLWAHVILPSPSLKASNGSHAIFRILANTRRPLFASVSTCLITSSRIRWRRTNQGFAARVYIFQESRVRVVGRVGFLSIRFIGHV